MKILYICNEYPPLPSGGIGVFVKSLGEALVEHGHEVYVHCMHPEIKKEGWTIDKGVNIYMLPQPKMRVGIISINELYQRWKQSLSVIKIVKEKRLDIVESYEWAGPLILHPKTKLIVRLHGGNYSNAHYEGKQASKLLRVFERRSLHIADAFVSVSKHMASLSKEAYHIKDPIRVIYNSFDPLLFFENRKFIPNYEQILFVGKFHQRKGVFEMFDRLKELFSEYPTMKFLFVGDYSREGKDQVLQNLPLNITSRIEFTGRIPHNKLVSYYQKSAFTLVPSRAEAFGLIAIEAMACGSIVIMQEGHVSNELIENRINGFVIDYNEKESLVKLFKSLPEKSELRIISTKAISFSNNFRKEKIIIDNINFYKSLLSYEN